MGYYKHLLYRLPKVIDPLMFNMAGGSRIRFVICELNLLHISSHWRLVLRTLRSFLIGSQTHTAFTYTHTSSIERQGSVYMHVGVRHTCTCSPIGRALAYRFIARRKGRQAHALYGHREQREGGGAQARFRGLVRIPGLEEVRKRIKLILLNWVILKWVSECVYLG